MWFKKKDDLEHLLAEIMRSARNIADGVAVLLPDDRPVIEEVQKAEHQLIVPVLAEMRLTLERRQSKTAVDMIFPEIERRFRHEFKSRLFEKLPLSAIEAGGQA